MFCTNTDALFEKPVRKRPHDVLLLRMTDAQRHTVATLLTRFGVTQSDAENTLDTLPARVLHAVSRARARELVQELLSIGAIAQVRLTDETDTAH